MFKMTLPWLILIVLASILIIDPASGFSSNTSYIVNQDSNKERKLIVIFKSGTNVPKAKDVCKVAKAYGYTAKIVTLVEQGKIIKSIQCK